MTNRCEKNNHVTKKTLELLDWMLAIDFDVSKIPAAQIYSPWSIIKSLGTIEDRFT